MRIVNRTSGIERVHRRGALARVRAVRRETPVSIGIALPPPFPALSTECAGRRRGLIKVVAQLHLLAEEEGVVLPAHGPAGTDIEPVAQAHDVDVSRDETPNDIINAYILLQRGVGQVGPGRRHADKQLDIGVGIRQVHASCRPSRTG